MIQSLSTVLAILVLTKVITGEEANLIQENLAGKEMPATWQYFIHQIELIIQRPLP